MRGGRRGECRREKDDAGVTRKKTLGSHTPPILRLVG
jgi:hypothetical protein